MECFREVVLNWWDTVWSRWDTGLAPWPYPLLLPITWSAGRRGGQEIWRYWVVAVCVPSRVPIKLIDRQKEHRSSSAPCFPSPCSSEDWSMSVERAQLPIWGRQWQPGQSWYHRETAEVCRAACGWPCLLCGITVTSELGQVLGVIVGTESAKGWEPQHSRILEFYCCSSYNTLLRYVSLIIPILFMAL